jgi:predicted transcriptional regulator with HTH domain
MQNFSLIKLSLTKSLSRYKVLRYLFDIYPEDIYLTDLARNLNMDINTTRNAIVGLTKHASINLSLKSLNLVEIKRINYFVFFKLSENGYKIANEYFNIMKNNVKVKYNQEILI